MKKEYEDQYHRVESDHWWFRGRRHIVRHLVLQGEPDRTKHILELGCSAGLLIRQLKQDGYRKVTGIDISGEAISLCRQQGLEDVHVMDAQRLTFRDAEFDAITASDVLEHLAEETQAVQEWRRILKPGGLVIVFVPAFQLLWSEHDEANSHHRRYRRGRLNELLAANGFIVERSSYWNVLLFFPVLLVRLLKRLKPKPHLRSGPIPNDLFSLPSPINSFLASLLILENRLISGGLNFPFGVSVMAVARKPRT